MAAKIDNMRIWDALGKTDPAHTKQFTRAGGFKGTAIKPMWANKQMTEFFGPCGVGWGMIQPQFSVVPALDELMVFCTVGLWYAQGDRSQMVYGVGGDKVLVKQSSGLRTDDEAFKKAYTDALSNAMKFIGVGADVHMGQFEDSKYVREVAGEFKKIEVEVEKQKATPAAVPPELDWSYQKSSGVLICRIITAEKKAKADGKEYVVITVNNELDKGKKPLLYYWHFTHREDLLKAVGKVVKLLIVAKEKGFTVEQVLEIDGVKTVPPAESEETKARLLASVLGFEEEELREMYSTVCKGSWTLVLEALKQRKEEVDKGVEAGER